MKKDLFTKMIMIILAITVLMPVNTISAQTGITWISTSTAVTQEAEDFIDLNRPAGITAGDFLLAHIAFLKGDDITLTVPDGWTWVRRDDRESNIGSAIYYKFASESEPNQYTWSFSEDVGITGSILAYRGVSATSPIIETSGRNGESDHPNAPSVNAQDNSKLVAFFSIKKDTTMSTPAGMTERYFINAIEDELYSKAADQDVMQGATGERISVVGDVDKWTAQMVALRYESDVDPQMPVLTLPEDRIVEATEETGATVNFVVTASDPQDGSLEVSCDPPSGSFFNLGTTPVTCSATDSDSNTVTGMFTVTVITGQTPNPIMDGVSTATTDEPASFLTVSQPAGAKEGDLLLAQIAFLKGKDISLTVPNGWTFVRRDDRETNIGSAIYYRFVSTSEPGPYIWGFSEDVSANAGIVAYENIDLENPILATSGRNGETLNPTAPAVEAVDNTTLVAFFSIKKRTPMSTPTGMAELYFLNPDGDERNSKATHEIVMAGDTGTRTSLVGDVDKWTAQLVALRSDTGAYPNAPVLTLPENIFVESDIPTVVEFSATAYDTIDGDIPVTCNPPSGSLFDLGRTNVTCSATDLDGNIATGSFTVTVGQASDPAPVQEGVTIAATTTPSTIITVNKPTGINEGDILLAQIAFLKGNDITLTAPAGWTFVRRDDRESNIGSAVYYKFVSNSEPGQYSWEFSEKVTATAGLIAYSGVDREAPIIGSSGRTGETLDPYAPGLTAADSSMLVAFFSIKKDAMMSTPDGMANLYFIKGNEDELNSLGADHALDAGPTGLRKSLVSDVDKWTAQLVLLRPEPVYELAGTSTTTVNSPAKVLTLNKPSMVSTGDFMLTQITFMHGFYTEVFAPDGWTLVRRDNNQNHLGSAIYYKFAGDFEPTAYNWNFNEDLVSNGGIIVYKNIDRKNPILGVTGNTGETTELTALGVDALDYSVLVGFFNIKKDTGIGTPSGMTELYSINAQSEERSTKATDEVVMAGFTGARTATAADSENWIAQLVALREEKSEPIYKMFLPLTHK